MFSTNVTMSKPVRAMLERHAPLFEQAALVSTDYIRSVVSYLDGFLKEGEGGPGCDRLLHGYAALLREHCATIRMRENAVTGDIRASGKVPHGEWLKYAGQIERHLAEAGSEPPFIGLTVIDGTSEAETERAAAVAIRLLVHTLSSAKEEMAVRPAWQHQPIVSALGRIRTVLGRPFDAPTVIFVLGELQDEGPSDLFRVMIREFADLGDPRGMTEEERLSSVRTRRALVDIGVLERRQEDPATCLALALPDSRIALGRIAESLNAWLEVDSDRWMGVHAFPVRLPMANAVVADLKDLGLLETHRAKLRLTRAGAEACQIAAPTKELAKES